LPRRRRIRRTAEVKEAAMFDPEFKDEYRQWLTHDIGRGYADIFNRLSACDLPIYWEIVERNKYL
jgi:hypothetical protein